jgi:hypothetical protein
MKGRVERLFRYVDFRVAMRYLRAEGVLRLLDDLKARHRSMGCDLLDYACFHQCVKRLRPRYVLECGTGVSTHVIAHAMERYSRPCHADARLVSMESEPAWFDEARKHIPGKWANLVELRLSEPVFVDFAFLRGTAYREVPALPYEVVYVDGPDPRGACNMDFLRVVAASDRPVLGVVDSRKSTVLAYQAMLGQHRLRSYCGGISFVGPVSRDDLVTARSEKTKEIFRRTIRPRQATPLLPLWRAAALCLVPIRMDRENTGV